jgi:hypothetical protein
MLLYGRQKIKMKHSKLEAENLHLERKQLLDDIEYKNRELATNVMYMVRKNEMINYISEKLLNTKLRFTPDNRKTIESIIIELQASMDENIWKTFEKRFQDVHKGFYKKINELYPKLTDNEIKLCALLRLNLNTKEIAAITHQNVNSIEVARHRLRKKLKLTNTDFNLNTFLSNL